MVGAGLGGMTAALRLAREGLSVLVVEAAFHPGGTAYAYRRGDFLFPMGPLGCAKHRLVRDALAIAGMGKVPDFRRVHYRLRAFDLSLTLSRPFRETAKELSRLFPHEARAIRTFFRDVESIAADLGLRSHFPPTAAADSGPSPHIPPHRTGPGKSVPGDTAEPEGRPPTPGQPLPFVPMGAAAYLESLVQDARLRRILGSMGTREPYSSLALLAAMWTLLCESGIHYPEGGFHGLSDSLASLLNKADDVSRPVRGTSTGLLKRDDAEPHYRAGARAFKGGIRPVVPCAARFRGSGNACLLLGRRVLRINTCRGRVCGVALDDRTSLSAGAVVSNADFKTTFLRLVDRDELPPSFLKRLEGAPLSPSNIQVCLGLDAGKVDLSAFDGCSRLIYRGGGDSTILGESGGDGSREEEPDPRRLAAGELELCLLSADDPALAPPGKAVLVIRASAPYEPFLLLRGRGKKRHPKYGVFKSQLGRAILREASAAVPGLEGSVEVMDVATPLTFEQRGGRFRGAVAGWSWAHREGAVRPVELVRTPLSGLFMAGHQALSMLALGGVPSAVLTGLRAAEYLLSGAGPAEDMEIPS